MTNSILDSTKKVLNLDLDDTSFDIDVLMHINSVFFDLNQLGVGPLDGFEIADKTTEWVAYLAGDKNLNAVKSYMYLRVRLLFDPPTTSFAIESFQKQIEKLEWRLNVHSDS